MALFAQQRNAIQNRIEEQRLEIVEERYNPYHRGSDEKQNQQSSIPMSPTRASLNQRVLIATSSLLLMALFIVGVAWGNAFSTREAAKALLRDVGGIRVGEATYAEAVKLSTKYAVYRTAASEPCSPTMCNYSFGFDNEWLSRLHLVPGTVLTVQVYVSDGKVTWIELMMGTSGIGGAIAVVQEFPSLKTGPHFAAGGKVVTHNPWHALQTNVQFTADAPTIDKERALAFNLSCLTKLGGCEFSEEMLPQVHVGEHPPNQ